MSPILVQQSKPLNHCKGNITFTLARRICIIVENQQQKLRHLLEVKENLKEYDYPVNIINGIKKALGIPQKELRKPKEKQTDEVLLFISAFNPNNPPVLKTNNVSGFESIKLIKRKRQLQLPDLNKLLTKAEFSK